MPDNLEVKPFLSWYGHYTGLTVIADDALVLP